MKPTKEEQQVQIENFWKKFGEIYSGVSEPFNSPLGLQLALQTKASQAKTILEAGCGSGFGSLQIVQILRPGSTCCCLDISKEMLTIFKQKYEASDFCKNPDNHFEVALDETTEKMNPESKVCPGRAIRVVKGNNEYLPFISDSFDCYIAACSLHLVANPVNMIAESFRVLKKGGLAGFSLPGKEKDSTYFSTISNKIRKYAEECKVELPKSRSIFYLGENEEGLLKLFKDAGFTQIRVWHHTSVFALTTKEFMQEKMFLLGNVIKAFPLDYQKRFVEELEQEIEKRFVEGNELITLDSVMITCVKN